MDMLKLLKEALAGKPKRKPGVAQAGNYAAPIDAEGLDPEMARTLGVVKAAPSDTVVVAKRQPAPTRRRAY